MNKMTDIMTALDNIKTGKKSKEKKNNKVEGWKMCNDSFNGFLAVCRLKQSKLKEYLHARLKEYYDAGTIVNDDGFLYVKGTLPVLVTAHMDTVHKKQCNNFYVRKEKGQHIVTSLDGIGGDDRCGVHMILKLLEKGYRPTVLFCEDEEVGGVGSNKFCRFENLVKEVKENCKYLIELDRANANDAVFYSCDNKDFHKYITETTGYKKAHGTFSDISHLSPEMDLASVNLSCGYYNAHTTNEYVNIEEMEHTIEVVEKLFNDLDNVNTFDYQEEQFSYYDGYYSSRCGGWYDDYDDYFYGGRGSKRNYIDIGDDYTPRKRFFFTFLCEEMEVEDYVEANNSYEALGMLIENYPMICYEDVLDIATEEIGKGV